MIQKSIFKDSTGSIIVTALLITTFFTITVLSLLSYANANVVRSKSRIYTLQAQYAAESGADHAIAILNSGDDNYAGTVGDILLIENQNFYRATYSVSVAAGANNKERVLTATGKVYVPANAAQPSYARTIEVIAERSSTSVAASMLSRNIIEAGSSVKDIKGKDIYVNGYIKLNKNVNRLIAENIIVADKDTSALNCSIGGTGDLVNPGTFTDPTQTKTKLTLAYNNCIEPPGNSTNANFDVLTNQTNIPKLQSLFIPWSYYMDNSYTNSPTGCSDWTAAGSILNIPSLGNDKATHYPDSGSNVSSSCGTSGNINLSSKTFVINDHVHVRADFCKTSACTPTFSNPTSDVKFVFIEGTLNFENVTTPPGSGPLVFIVYGADPASKSSVCPLGGAVYLGKSGTTSAPSLYLLSMNGVCLDKTRFGTAPALGGVAGKNIWVETNSGTPFDLSFDVNFPVSEIPVDLAWRASQYRRL
jgi:hypothetical protein